jgi:hypothetical protein
MKISQSDLKEIYANYLKDRRSSSGDSCPSDEDLLSWLRSKLPKKGKNRITDHVVNCYDCAEEVTRLLNRIRKQNGIIYEIKKSVDANYAKLQHEALAPPRRFSWKIVSFSSALVLLAAVAFFSVSYFSPKPGLRGGVSFDITPVSPVNKSCNAYELKFAWKDLPNMKYCFVEVFDSTLDLLWRSNAVLQREVIPPNDLLHKLIPKETYFWMVTGVLESEAKVKSRLKEFKIR